MGLPTVKRFGLWFGLENRFDGPIEQLSDAKGERQTGVVFAGFDGVYRLTRDFQPHGYFRLRPLTLGPNYANPVFHQIRCVYRYFQTGTT